jgi:hypothetical protein
MMHELQNTMNKCEGTPLHSLTGPVGQPFASHLGGQPFAPRGVYPQIWNFGILLLQSPKKT